MNEAIGLRFDEQSAVGVLFVKASTPAADC